MLRLIIDKLLSGNSQMQVAKLLNFGKSTIQKIWSKYTATGSIIDQPRNGRPLKTSLRERRMICRHSKSNPFLCATMLINGLMLKNNISVWTVRRILRESGLFARIAVRKPLLNNIQIKKNRLVNNIQLI